MKNILIILVAVGVLAVVFSGGESGNSGTSSKPQTSGQASTKSTAPPACNGHTITGAKLNVLGSSINVRSGPGTQHSKIVNEKATRILGSTQYISIDDTTVVYEECTSGNWSWIRVVDPDWLKDSHRGWVASQFLDKGQQISGDPYARKISSSALTPYSRQGYPKTFQKYGSRIQEIEKFRRKAAEMAADSGKCDFVTMSELSDSKSSLNHLHFWVDCRNKQRVYLDEFQLAQSGTVLTEEERSWSESSAKAACRQAIKDRALIPSEVDIHEIFGVSFYKAPQTHNAVLRMDFDAKNAYGQEIPYTATCHFKPGELGTIEVNPRN